MSRKSSFTEALAESVLEHVAEGKSIRSWARVPGRPSNASVTRWALADPDGFGRLLQDAFRIRDHGWAEELVEISDEPVHDMPGAQRQRLRLDTRKWIISRHLPHDYGDRLHLSGQHLGSNVTVTVTLPAKSGGAPLLDGVAQELLEDQTEDGTEGEPQIINLAVSL
jgi:hypothetical protein